MLKAHRFATRSFALVSLRAISILTIVSLLAPIAAIGEDSRQTSSARKRTARQAAPPPNNAPPEPFIFPRENRKTDGFLAEALSYFSTSPSLIQEQEASNEVVSASSKENQDAVSTKDEAPDTRTEELAPAETEAPVASAPETNAEADPISPAKFTQPAGTVDFDFDGDGKSDVGRWNPSTLDFVVKNSNGGSLTSTSFYLATSAAKSAPADYDNDGKTDMAVFEGGTWYIRKSSDSTHTTISSFGQAGDIPMSGDYRGGTGDELAIYRPSNQTWYWREFGSATVYSHALGTAGDIPAPGDFDGDGKLDWTVYRPSTGYWYIDYNAGGNTSQQWGISTDVPVVADYDGDGVSDIAVYRPIAGQWWVIQSTDGAVGGSWGNPGDQPVVGDFDGDGKSDCTVFRPATGRWHIFKSSTLLGYGESLGQAGDTAVASSYITQTGSNVAPDVINAQRLLPRNATGGTDLFSQNFGWSRGLVNLPGRSGMDLGLGISYNSLVWTKIGTAMVFNPDWHHTIAPGFNVGFPTIEPTYLNSKTGVYHYMMVTPSGSRIEFVQKDASNLYETMDSSYTRLFTTGNINPTDPVEGITIYVFTTDGTKMTYVWDGGAFRCTQVKDRNGNYISITYDPNDQGLITTVTDTLGRVLNFNYDGTPSLSTITQTWKGSNGSGSNTTHTYATISYGTKTIDTDFHSSLTQFGIYNGTDLKVVDKVTYADGSFTKFHYNDYGQAWKVEEHAADSTGGSPHVLNHVRTNLESPSADQTDVPRYTQVWNKVENFNSGTETTATITRSTGQSYTSPDGGSPMTATKIEVAMTGHPHNAVSKSWYGESGWKDGLPLATEDWADGTSGSEMKRWTLTSYEQDEPSFTYKVNPRVNETKVGDGINTRRSVIKYSYYPETTTAIYGLPIQTRQFDADQTTVLKETNIEYNWNEDLINQYIIGLPVTVESHGMNQLTSTLELVSKVTYAYDEGAFSDSGLQQNISPVQHDSTNYGSGFSIRGNLTSTKRWDVTTPANGANAITTSSLKYNTAGSVVSNTTPWDGTNTRTVKIGYADVWNSSGNPTTYAYPTTMTDPANISSTVKYRYDIGTNVEANSPAPTGQTYGKTTKRIYDSIGRLERNSVYVNTTEQSYVRYEFPTNGIQSKVYAPIVDQDGDGNIAEDEVYSESLYDGAGRPRMSRKEHPGSTGGWSSTFVEYDILGQIKRQSVPTETNSSYAPTGDDSSGPLWTYNKYDWMGRVVRKINTDGVDSPTLNDSDILISYEGCGCAGGLVTTVEGELVPRTDTTGNARRKQKSYADILGRTFQTETFEWDGTTVYSSNKVSFNGRDQVLLARQYAGSTASTTYQSTTATFDGMGRVVTKHIPKQDANANTAFAYNADGSVANVTDARGAVTNYTYNNRGLVTQITSLMPTSGSGTSNIAPIDPPEEDPEPTPPATQGWVESVSHTEGEWKIKGWALDPDAPNQSIQVHIYANGRAGTPMGIYVGAVTANIPRSDVNASTGQPGNHGFEYTIPSEWTAYNHPFYVYGIDSTSSGSELLQGSPKDLTGSPDWGDPELEMTVSYTYDNLGNRVSMTDQEGNVQYEYSALGQLTAETRQFNDSMPNAPIVGNKFKLQYDYALSGQLKSYTDPFGEQISYTNDRMGRMKSVTASEFDGVTTYADNVEYSSWGAIKGADYVGDIHLAMDYDNRLSAESMSLQKTTDLSFVLNKQYEYYSDGKIKFLEDLADERFDRLNTYDFAGRIKTGLSGEEARNQPVTDPEETRPYSQTYGFDHFGNMTQTTNSHWGQTSWDGQSFNQTTTYANGRIQKPGWVFDADGRVTQSVGEGFGNVALAVFNAAGKVVRTYAGNKYDTRTFYDGNGQDVKQWSTSKETLYDSTEIWKTQPVKYKIRSSVMKGAVVSEVWASGKKHRTFIKSVGNQTAVQTAYATPTSSLDESIVFEYSDASGMSYRTRGKAGEIVAWNDGGEGSPIETDPLGGSVGTSTPYIEPEPYEPAPGYPDMQPFPINQERGPQFDIGRLYSLMGSRIADLPGFGTNWGSNTDLALMLYDESVHNARIGLGFNPNESFGAPPGVRLSAQHIGTITTYGGTDSSGPGDNGILGDDDDEIIVNTEATITDIFHLSWDESVNLFDPLVFGDEKWSVDVLRDAAKKIIEEAMKDPKGECSKLLGKDALNKFNEVAGDMFYGGNVNLPVADFGDGNTLSQRPQLNAFVTDDNLIVLNPNGYAFRNDLDGAPGTPKSFQDGVQKMFKDAGAANQWEYAVAVVLHEFLHTTGKFGKDVKRREDGSLDTRQSQKNQERVLESCFKKK